MKHADMEMTVMKGEDFILTYPQKEEAYARQGHTGKHQVGQEAEGGAVWTRDFTAVSVEGVDKAGGQAEGWLVWIIPAGSGPQGPSLVVWYLPWVMRAGGQGTRGGEPHGGGGGVWALGWLVCIGRLCS